MNAEIVIGFLNEHTSKCPYRQLSSNIKDKPCNVCNQINRDISLLIANVQGARKTIDVGLAVVPCEGLTPYLPYQIAGFKIFVQNGENESNRIKNVLSETLMRGYDSVILISNRVPNLPVDYIEEALKILRKENDTVLGPLKNGMFYLIGAKKTSLPVVLRLIEKNNFTFNRVNGQFGFLNSLKQKGIHPYILPQWYLIRTIDDLKKLYIDFQHGIGWKARWTHDYLKKRIFSL